MSIYTNQFYVYIYLREDGTPYYVGKGKGKRAWSNTGRAYKAPNDPERIIIHTDNLTEEQAFSLEMDLIAHYGRKDNGTGILRNLTDGGDGVSGYKHSEEECSRRSERLLGRSLPDSIKKKISESHTGKKLTKETRDKMSKSRMGSKNPSFGKGRPCVVNGVRYDTIQQAANAHGIRHDTALYRCKNKSKGWSYV